MKHAKKNDFEELIKVAKLIFKVAWYVINFTAIIKTLFS